MDAVVACVDAGTSRDFIGDEGAGGGGGGAASKAGGDASKAAADPSYTPDAAVRAEIDAVITSVLSRLVGPEMVRETVKALEQMAAELTRPTPYAGEPPKDLFCAANYAPAQLIRAVMRLGLLAGTAAGLQVRALDDGGARDACQPPLALPSASGRQRGALGWRHGLRAHL